VKFRWSARAGGRRFSIGHRNAPPGVRNRLEGPCTGSNVYWKNRFPMGSPQPPLGASHSGQVRSQSWPRPPPQSSVSRNQPGCVSRKDGLTGKNHLSGLCCGPRLGHLSKAGRGELPLGLTIGSASFGYNTRGRITCPPIVTGGRGNALHTFRILPPHLSRSAGSVRQLLPLRETLRLNNCWGLPAGPVFWEISCRTPTEHTRRPPCTRGRRKPSARPGHVGQGFPRKILEAREHPGFHRSGFSAGWPSTVRFRAHNTSV